MRKKLIALLLVIACFVTLAIGLTACGDKSYKIAYDLQNGNGLTGQAVLKSVQYEFIPTRDGYFFRGWYLDSSCTGDRVEFPFELKKDTVLYAKWEKDTRTPLEKFIDAGGKYNTKFNDGEFVAYFEYKSDTQKINVYCSYIPGNSHIYYFRLDFDFKIGDLKNGVGTIKATGSEYSVELSSNADKSVSIVYTYISGTDWDKLGLSDFKYFVNKIPGAFREFYNWCLSEYELAVY